MTRAAALLTTAALAVLAFLGVALHPPNNLDVAWYLVAARTWDAGGELYVTLRDPNTPAVWYLFLGVHRLAEALGLPAHRLFYILVALASLALLAFAAWLLPANDAAGRRRQWATLLGGAFLCGFLGLTLAGQREPLAVLLVLPYLAWTQRLAEGADGARGGGLLATLLAGLAVLIKPHFLLWLLAAEALLAWRRRGWMGWRRADLLLPALATLLLGGLLLALHPAYLDYLADWAAYYAAFPAAPLDSRQVFALGLLGLLLLYRLLLGGRDRGWGDPLAIAALAALATALLQDKWWGYQSMPLESFAGLAWLALLLEAPAGWPRPRWRRSALALLALAALGWFAGAAVSAAKQQWRFVLEDYRQPEPEALASALDRLAPTQPVAILGGPGPLGAYLSGTLWALPDPSYWVVDLVQAQRQRGQPLSALLRDAERRNLDAVATALAALRPKLIAIHRGAGRDPVDALPYYQADPRIGALLADYQRVGNAGGYDLWHRGDQDEEATVNP
jgi:hypothetical protein